MKRKKLIEQIGELDSETVASRIMDAMVCKGENYLRLSLHFEEQQTFHLPRNETTKKWEREENKKPFIN